MPKKSSVLLWNPNFSDKAIVSIFNGTPYPFVMRTGLVRKYGERNTVPEYIDVVIKHHRCSEEVRTIALKMYNHIAQNTTFSGRYPSMLAMTIVFLAAKECYNDIPSSEWTGGSTCSYNTLLIHSKELKAVLEKLEDFPNLKIRTIGR